MLLNSSLRAPFVQLNQPNIVAIPPVKPPELPSVPFARFPHALASDARLSPTDRLVACALLFWARDKSTADMANRSLAEYLGVSVATIERSIRRLIELGYILTRAVKPTPTNMTGRVVVLRWVEDASVLPELAIRSSASTAKRCVPRVAREGTHQFLPSSTNSPEGPSPVMDPVHQGGGGGSLTAEGEPPSPVRDKEDRLVKKLEKLENTRTESLAGQRQRPEAASLDAPPELPQVITAERPIRIRNETASTVPANPLPAPWTSDLLTAGQRQALAAMTEAERAAFERKSPGMRADILRPFERGFEPKLFERMTRAQLVVPRFVAEARPVDRSTPGLVAAVAGGDPTSAAALAEALCQDLGGSGDRRRWGAIHRMTLQLLRREVGAEDVLDAYRQAMGPKAANRGALFTHALKRTGWNP